MVTINFFQYRKYIKRPLAAARCFFLRYVTELNMVYEQNETLCKYFQTILPSHPPSVCVGVFHSAAECPEWVIIRYIPIPRRFVCESPRGISFRSWLGYNWVHSHPPSVCVGLTLSVKTFLLFSLPIPRHCVWVSRGVFYSAAECVIIRCM